MDSSAVGTLPGQPDFANASLENEVLGETWSVSARFAYVLFEWAHSKRMAHSAVACFDAAPAEKTNPEQGELENTYYSERMTFPGSSCFERLWSEKEKKID